MVCMLRKLIVELKVDRLLFGQRGIKNPDSIKNYDSGDGVVVAVASKDCTAV
jgi:hypothetical protein